jgi:hypothetical protein|tara:strand:- start:1189 stop:2625 length:1437 start_codon:yes stop_codon:yes gene_type:complete
MQQEQISLGNLPLSMRYSVTSVPAVEASSTLARFDSTNGNSNFSPTGADQIRIRVKADGFMDTSKHYLFFSVNTTTAGANIDGDANSFFDRITIESNGVLIEQIDRYALYSGIKRNWDSTNEELIKSCGESGGDYLKTTQALGAFGLAAADTAAAVKVASDAFLAASNGLALETALSNLGDALVAAESKNFAIQLNSGMLKNIYEKALPEGLNEFEIILRLKSATGAVVGTGAGNNDYTIDNPRLYVPCYKIENGDVMASFRNAMASQGVSWVGMTAKTYINTLSNNANKQILQINDRSQSLYALVSAIRSNDADTQRLDYSNTATLVNFAGGYVQSYVYKLMGQNYPQSEIEMNLAENGLNVSRAYEEAVKAWARPGHKYSNCNVTLNQFKSLKNAYTSVTNSASNDGGKGLVSVDLKTFDSKELRMKGINTAMSGAPGTLEITMSGAPGANQDITTFALIEATYIVNPNGSMAVIQ